MVFVTLSLNIVVFLKINSHSVKSALLSGIHTYPRVSRAVADPGFSWGGANSQSGCANLLFCMKMKELGYRGGRVPGTPTSWIRQWRVTTNQAATCHVFFTCGFNHLNNLLRLADSLFWNSYLWLTTMDQLVQRNNGTLVQSMKQFDTYLANE